MSPSVSKQPSQPRTGAAPFHHQWIATYLYHWGVVRLSPLKQMNLTRVGAPNGIKGSRRRLRLSDWRWFTKRFTRLYRQLIILCRTLRSKRDLLLRDLSTSQCPCSQAQDDCKDSSATSHETLQQDDLWEFLTNELESSGASDCKMRVINLKQRAPATAGEAWSFFGISQVLDDSPCYTSVDWPCPIVSFFGSISTEIFTRNPIVTNYNSGGISKEPKDGRRDSMDIPTWGFPKMVLPLVIIHF